MPTQAYYLADGTRVPGVTTVIKNLGWGTDALLGWARKEALAGRNHRDTMEKAADVGTLAHSLVEANLRGAFVDLSPFPEDVKDLALTAYRAWMDWRATVSLRVHSLETPLVSEELRCGGTLDFVGWTVDGLTLIDWKTSSGIYGSHRIQVAAYTAIWNEVRGFSDGPVTQACIVRFGKDGTLETVTLTEGELNSGLRAFRALRELHDAKRILEPGRE